MTAPPPLPEADAFRQECRVLHALLAGLDAAGWDEPTDFKGWTPYGVLGHLYMFDEAARLSLEGAEAHAAYTAGYREAADRVAYTRAWLGGVAGAELLDRWLLRAEATADAYRGVDPRRRVPWGPGTMSARSCISARQMETWAHGQAVFDLLGVARPESDRLRNIAVICVNTWDWAFRNRNLAPPADKPLVSLEAPSGARWTWNEGASGGRITGAAVEFCQVCAQTRNVADTSLRVEGEAAGAWMAIAQCFAGPPHDPPAPGTRGVRRPAI